jgi:hypothetical protein
MLSRLYRRLPSGFINYQNFKIMLLREIPFKTVTAFFVFPVLMLTFLILSCNSNKGKTEQAQTAFASVTVPSFRIDKVDLKRIYDAPKNMRKLILKWGVNSFADPSDVSLLVYGATDQVHHGQNEMPLQNVRPQGTSSITSPIIIGNNYIDLQNLLYDLTGAERDFTYVLLSAKNGTGSNKNHLFFEFKLIKEVKKANNEIEAQTIYSGESQPSPPANAGP